MHSSGARDDRNETPAVHCTSTPLKGTVFVICKMSDCRMQVHSRYHISLTSDRGNVLIHATHFRWFWEDSFKAACT